MICIVCKRKFHASKCGITWPRYGDICMLCAQAGWEFSTRGDGSVTQRNVEEYRLRKAQIELQTATTKQMRLGL